MNEKQELLYQNLKSIKDVWKESAVDSLNPNTDLIAWTDVEESLKIMQQKLSSQEELEAYKESLQEDIALHEEFYGYLLDKEEV